ncbi:hypothetical protein Tco_0327835 [Tanacetum coccineum]
MSKVLIHSKTANTPPQSAGNTPTDTDDDIPKDGVFSTNSFDAENTDNEEEGVTDYTNMDPTIDVCSTPTQRIHKNHPQSQIIGESTAGVLTRRKLKESASVHHQALLSFIYKQNRTNHKDQQTCLFACFLSQEEPKKVSQALINESWVEDYARRTYFIKLQDEEGVDYDEVFAPFGRIEVNPVFFLASCIFHGLYCQSDGNVKSAFLNAIQQKRVCKTTSRVLKTCSSKQGLQSLPGTLRPFHQAHEHGKDEEGEDVDVHLYRSMIGCLMYLTASRPDIMFAVCLCARFQVTPKVSHLHAVKRIFRYLKHQPNLGLWYPKDSPFHLEAFSDSDYAGDNHDRRSTSGGCQYLGRRLVSWQCKKQTIVAISSTEAEYVAAASCCAQVLWMQNQLLDYGFNFMNTEIHIDNESTICIVKNPVFHSKTKHIQIRHHFIRDCYEQRLINVVKVHTDDNVADLLTKGFDLARFNFLVIVCKVEGLSLHKFELEIFFKLKVLLSQLKVLLVLENGGDSECCFLSNHDFLTGCSIKLLLLLVDPDLIGPWLQQFWATATLKVINDVPHIRAKVAGKKILISEATIRADLLFDDENGVDCFPKHSFGTCRDPKSTSWEQFGTNIASALVGLATNQKFNFSLMILTGMLGHISNGTPFLMYPRFVQLFLNKQLEGVDRPQDFIPSVSLPSKVFTFMRKHSTKFSCRITPLTPSMLEVVTALAAEEEHSTSPHSRAASSARDAQGTPTQSAAHSQRTASVQGTASFQGTATSQGTAEIQRTADFQGTAEPHDAASIPKSPNDYTPTDASQTSGGDEGLLDIYALNREVKRLKRQTLSQAKQIIKLKAKLKKLSKFVQPVIKHHAFWVENQNLKKQKRRRKKHKKKVSSVKLGRNKDEGTLSEEHYVQEEDTADPFFDDIADKDAAITPDLERKSDETEEVNIEEKEASNVRSGDTEELDLETTQPQQPRGLSIPGPIQTQPQQPTQGTDPKDKGNILKVAEVIVLFPGKRLSILVPYNLNLHLTIISSTDPKDKEQRDLRKEREMLKEKEAKTLKEKGKLKLSALHSELEDGTMIHMLAKRSFLYKRVVDMDARSMVLDVEDENEIAHTFDNLLFCGQSKIAEILKQLLASPEQTVSVEVIFSSHGLLPFLGTQELTSQDVIGSTRIAASNVSIPSLWVCMCDFVCLLVFMLEKEFDIVNMEQLEDTAYLWLDFTSNHEDIKTNTPYTEDLICRIEDQIFSVAKMKVIKYESEALGLLMIDEDLFTYDTPLGMILIKFNQLSGMDDDLFTYEEKIPKLPYLPNFEQLMNNLDDGNPDVYERKVCYDEKKYVGAVIFINKSYKKKFEEYMELKRQREVYGFHTDVLMDPSNAEFQIEELSDLEEENLNDNEMEPKDDTEHSCRSFCFKNELTKWPTYDWKNRGYCNGGDLPRVTRIGDETHFESYDWYKDLEDGELKEEALICKDIFEESITMNDESSRYARTQCLPANESEDFEHANHMEADVNSNYNPYLDISRIFNNAGMNNDKNIQDKPELIGDDDDDVGYLEDYLTKKDPPHYVNEEEERSNERRCKLLGVPYVKPPTSKTEKFEVVKYSFGPTEEYVAITEYEYDIWVRTEENVYHLYQDIFHKKNEGWFILRADLSSQNVDTAYLTLMDMAY